MHRLSTHFYLYYRVPKLCLLAPIFIKKTRFNPADNSALRLHTLSPPVSLSLSLSSLHLTVTLFPPVSLSLSLSFRHPNLSLSALRTQISLCNLLSTSNNPRFLLLSAMSPRRLLGVLAAAFLLTECVAAAATFSSRLVHRFSDEVKALRVSRKGMASSAPWPERRSLEYYRLLASSDLERQKMRVDSKYQLLFPSEGSQTMSLGNDFGW